MVAWGPGLLGQDAQRKHHGGFITPVPAPGPIPVLCTELHVPGGRGNGGNGGGMHWGAPSAPLGNPLWGGGEGVSGGQPRAGGVGRAVGGGTDPGRAGSTPSPAVGGTPWHVAPSGTSHLPSLVSPTPFQSEGAEHRTPMGPAAPVLGCGRFAQGLSSCLCGQGWQLPCPWAARLLDCTDSPRLFWGVGGLCWHHQHRRAGETEARGGTGLAAGDGAAAAGRDRQGQGESCCLQGNPDAGNRLPLGVTRS